MKTLKFRFFSVSAKIIIVYCSIIAVFAFAFLANYYLSVKDIESKLIKVNEEYFVNKVSFIEGTFKDIKNNAYELRNYMAGREKADFNNPIEKSDHMSRLSRLVTYYNYIDDAFVYNTQTEYFISTQGSMEIDVYFRMSYYEETFTGKWNTVTEGNKDIVINVTKYPNYDEPERKDFYKRLLYVDIDYLGDSNFIVGFIIDIDNVIRNENKLNADINNFFVIKNDSGNAFRDFLYNSFDYKDSSTVFKMDGTVGMFKFKDNHVFYQYDLNKDLIYLNTVNMKQYLNRLGYFNFLPIVLTSLLLILTIVLASSFLSRFYRSMKSIRTFLEGDFIKSVVEERQGNKFIDDIKDFIGLKGIRRISVIMLSASLKTIDINKIDTHGFYKFFDRFLEKNNISFRSFYFIKLKRIYIIDAKSVKNYTSVVKSIQKLLSDSFDNHDYMSVNIFVSGIYNERDGIEKAVNELVYLSETIPVKIINKVVLLEKDVADDYFHFPGEFGNMLRNTMMSGDKQQTLSLGADLLNKNIESGAGARNFKSIILKINNIILETIFERYNELYDNSLKIINKINNLLEEIGAPYIIQLYDELLAKISFEPEDDDSEKSRLQQRFVDYIKENYNKDIYLETMAEYFNLSTKYISSKFKDITGEKFTDYLKKYRINIACTMLKNTNKKINEISESVGYNNVNVFIRHFKSVEGITPKSFRDLNS